MALTRWIGYTFLVSLNHDETALLVPSATAVRGAFPDTDRWRANYERLRLTVISALRSAPAVLEALRGIGSDQLYQLAVPVNPPVEANGLISGVLRAKGGGEIIRHLSFKPVSGLPSALTALALQAALQDAIWRLEQIDSKLGELLHSQFLDRIGKFAGAEHAFQAAQQANNPETRRAMMVTCQHEFHLAMGPIAANLRNQVARLREPNALSRFWWREPAEEFRNGAKEADAYLQCLVRGTHYLVTIAAIELGEREMARSALMTLANYLPLDVIEKGYKLSRWLQFSPDDPPEGAWLRLRALKEWPIQVDSKLDNPLAQLEIELRADDLS